MISHRTLGGNGGFGKLGHGDTNNRLLPSLVDALNNTPIQTMECGINHMGALASKDTTMQAFTYLS